MSHNISEKNAIKSTRFNYNCQRLVLFSITGSYEDAGNLGNFSGKKANS